MYWRRSNIALDRLSVGNELMSNFFRKEVTDNHLVDMGVPLRITPRWMHFFTSIFVVFIILLIGIIYFGSYSRKANVEGFVLPEKGIIKISSPREGRVKKSYVVEGQQVKQGALLFVVDVGAESIGGNTIDATYKILIDRQTLIGKEIQVLEKIEKADAYIIEQDIHVKRQAIKLAEEENIANDENILLLKSITNRHEKLVDKKLVTIATLEEARKNWIEAKMRGIALKRSHIQLQSDLTHLEIEFKLLAGKQATTRSKFKQILLELDQQIKELDNQRAILIRAPEDGIVTRVISTKGSAVDIDFVMLSLLPSNAALEALLYVPSKDAGFINIGTEILLRYDAYPYQKFGLYKAHVSTISQAPVIAAELPFPTTDRNNEPMYVVTAKLEQTFIIVSGKKRLLQVGTKFRADLILEKRQIWEWLLGPIRTLQSST